METLRALSDFWKTIFNIQVVSCTCKRWKWKKVQSHLNRNRFLFFLKESQYQKYDCPITHNGFKDHFRALFSLP